DDPGPGRGDAGPGDPLARGLPARRHRALRLDDRRGPAGLPGPVVWPGRAIARRDPGSHGTLEDRPAAPGPRLLAGYAPEGGDRARGWASRGRPSMTRTWQCWTSRPRGSTR